MHQAQPLQAARSALATAVVTPAPGVAVHVAVPPPVRVADTSTKPASFAGIVKTSRNTTPGAVDGPSLA